jgi:hypothetical protein
MGAHLGSINYCLASISNIDRLTEIIADDLEDPNFVVGRNT